MNPLRNASRQPPVPMAGLQLHDRFGGEQHGG